MVVVARPSYECLWRHNTLSTQQALVLSLGPVGMCLCVKVKVTWHTSKYGDHTWICALQLTHSKCTHTAVNTHTPWTHTQSKWSSCRKVSITSMLSKTFSYQSSQSTWPCTAERREFVRLTFSSLSHYLDPWRHPACGFKEQRSSLLISSATIRGLFRGTKWFEERKLL